MILGLSEGNIERLRRGDPIHFHGKQLNLPCDVMIVWGETEAKIADSLGMPNQPEPVRVPRN